MFITGPYSPALRALAWALALAAGIGLILLVALTNVFPNVWIRAGMLVIAIVLGGSGALSLIGQSTGRDTSGAMLYFWVMGSILGFVLVVVGFVQFFAARGGR